MLVKLLLIGDLSFGHQLLEFLAFFDHVAQKKLDLLLGTGEGVVGLCVLALEVGDGGLGLDDELVGTVVFVGL